MDSIESAVERALVLIEHLSCELSKGDCFSGLVGLSKLSVEKLEKGFQNLFRKAEECLFVSSETKLRVTNFLAWLYKTAKKLEPKKEDNAEAPERPEDNILKDHNIDRNMLVSFLQTEDSFFMRYLGSYVKIGPMRTKELTEMGFDYFNSQRNSSNKFGKKVQLNDVETEEAVREQSLAFSFGIINQFCERMTGEALQAPSQPSRAMDEEKPVEESNLSFRGMLKGLTDAVKELKSNFSSCLEQNTKLVKTVVENSNTDRPGLLPVQKRPAHIFPSGEHLR